MAKQWRNHAAPGQMALRNLRVGQLYFGEILAARISTSTSTSAARISTSAAWAQYVILGGQYGSRDTYGT